MNVRSYVKTAAVALPLVFGHGKAAAQDVVKVAEKAAQEVVKPQKVGNVDVYGRALVSNKTVNGKKLYTVKSEFGSVSFGEQKAANEAMIMMPESTSDYLSVDGLQNATVKASEMYDTGILASDCKGVTFDLRDGEGAKNAFGNVKADYIYDDCASQNKHLLDSADTLSE